MTWICLSNQVVHPKPRSKQYEISEQADIPEQHYQTEFLVKPLISVNINYHDNEKTYQVPYDSIAHTLQRLNITLDETDVLPFDADEFIYPSQIISIPKIEEKLFEKNEIIHYQTKNIPSDDLLDGESVVVQKGRDGKKAVTYKEEYFNDKLWHRFQMKETILVPVQNEIIKTGTQNIIEIKNADLKNEKSVLVKTKFDDKNFSLPKVKLSEKDRDLLERLLTGEFGSSFTGAALVAQAIKCAIVYDKYTSMESLINGMGYVGSTNIGKTQSAVDAAKFIFDENGLAVKHRLFYMCTEDYFNSEPGNFHSTQNFILQYENVKFFDRW